MSTLASLRGKARGSFIKIDPRSKVRGDDVLDNYINMGYVQVQTDGNNEWREQQTSATLSTVSGQQEYDLSTNFPSFLKMTKVMYDNFPIDQIRKEDTYNGVTASGSPTAYYIYGTDFGLYPTPNQVKTITALYNKSLPLLTSSQDSLLPDDFDNLIVLYATYLAAISVEKNDKAMAMLNEYKQMLAQLKIRYKMDSNQYTWYVERQPNSYGFGPKASRL